MSIDKRFVFLISSILVICCCAGKLFANDFNQWGNLDPRVNSKTSAFKAKNPTMGNQGSALGTPHTSSNCNSVIVGPQISNGIAPREVTIVTGDIYNINNGGCR